MRQLLVRRLKARRPQVLEDWEDLLRRQQVTTPLANPDIFVHEMGTTFDSVINQLGRAAGAASFRRISAEPWPPACHCGRNPFLPYYLTAEEVFVAALIRLQGAMCQKRLDQQLAEQRVVRLVVRSLGRRDIDGFGALCQACPNAQCGRSDRPCPRSNLIALRGVAAEPAEACGRHRVLAQSSGSA